MTTPDNTIPDKSDKPEKPEKPEKKKQHKPTFIDKSPEKSFEKQIKNVHFAELCIGGYMFLLNTMIANGIICTEGCIHWSIKSSNFTPKSKYDTKEITLERISYFNNYLQLNDIIYHIKVTTLSVTHDVIYVSFVLFVYDSIKDYIRPERVARKSKKQINKELRENKDKKDKEGENKPNA